MINLGLIKCPYCQSHISKLAEKCPKCQEWLNKEKIEEIVKTDKKNDKAENIGCIVFNIILCFDAIFVAFLFFNQIISFFYSCILFVTMIFLGLYMTDQIIKDQKK